MNPFSFSVGLEYPVVDSDGLKWNMTEYKNIHYYS